MMLIRNNRQVIWTILGMLTAALLAALLGGCQAAQVSAEVEPSTWEWKVRSISSKIKPTDITYELLLWRHVPTGRCFIQSWQGIGPVTETAPEVCQ